MPQKTSSCLRGYTQCPSRVDDFENLQTGTRPSHSKSIKSISPVGKGFARRNGLICPPSGERGSSLFLDHVFFDHARYHPSPSLSSRYFCVYSKIKSKQALLQAFNSRCGSGGVPVPTLEPGKDISAKVLGQLLW